ncbi:ThiF family adenylyltransferase [Bradyrhizobium australafricanum]|uniref:ThiF family adenylyltransferase n=1 Tax=Bradyrhizobium australafricanum TaxID=2821406 RepID=UPI001CE2388D|nr:ThiF family adenylyltransferase [Bradyrhizobium australafricanum]MCA6098160.1 ThiF family adenylyltransferase [Bradyrhizobium australafricanum]
MKLHHTLVLPAKQADQLREHLFPGDGLEAAALLLCTVTGERRPKWLGREVICVPHAECTRRPDFITWPGEFVEAAMDCALARGDAVVAVHSHPGGLFAFSSADDESDRILMNAIRHGTDRAPGSAIMIASGAMRARVYEDDRATPIDLVMKAGADIETWWNDGATGSGPLSPPMAFTGDMRASLSRLSICLIGVSGTGSIVAEQLARLGVGEIILIDFDKIEERNLNRILNATRDDIGVLKVEMFADAIRRYRRDGEVISVPCSVATREAILAAREADILFSCVDSAEGRHIADRLSAYFAMPLFDVGVAIPTEPLPDGGRRIAEVYGRVDYVYPGGSSLMDRGVYDAALLEAEYLARTAPHALAGKIADGYLRGMAEEAPGVITLNMRAASACVMEFIARLFPFREFANETRARTIFMLAEGDEDAFSEGQFKNGHRFPVADGEIEPLLGLPALAKRRRVA